MRTLLAICILYIILGCSQNDEKEDASQKLSEYKTKLLMSEISKHVENLSQFNAQKLQYDVSGSYLEATNTLALLDSTEQLVNSNKLPEPQHLTFLIPVIAQSLVDKEKSRLIFVRSGIPDSSYEYLLKILKRHSLQNDESNLASLLTTNWLTKEEWKQEIASHDPEFTKDECEYIFRTAKYRLIGTAFSQADTLALKRITARYQELVDFIRAESHIVQYLEDSLRGLRLK